MWLLHVNYFNEGRVSKQVQYAAALVRCSMFLKHDFLVYCVHFCSVSNRVSHRYLGSTSLQQHQMHYAHALYYTFQADHNLLSWLFLMWVMGSVIHKMPYILPKALSPKLLFQKAGNLITKRKRRQVTELNYGRKQHKSHRTFSQINSTQSSPGVITRAIGGGCSHVFSANMIAPYLSADELKLDYTKTAFKFVDHVDSTGLCLYPVHKGFVHAKMPLT